MLLDQYGQKLPTTPTVAQRAMAAMRASVRSELAAAYDAAQTTGENQKHWRYADDLSATAANSLEVRRQLRQRARYECLQSNSFGNGIVNTIANDTIATGASLQVQMERQYSQAIETKFWSWAKKVKLARKLRTARLAKCVDGETFIMKVNNPVIRDAVQLDIQVIEADQVSTPGWIEGRPGAVDGIVFDRYNNPAVYHVLKQHPGDTWVINSFEKYDVLADDMIHLFNAVRPGQARGIPEVTPALPLFAMLRRYTLATILAAETAADLAAVIQTTANAYDSTGQSTDPSIQPFDTVQIDRGMMISLPHGWQMNQFRPEQPTSTYEQFRNAILQEIARCVHMPENKALGSSASYNYSSAQLDDQIYWHSIRMERETLWEPDCLDRIFGWWFEEAINIPGYLPPLPVLGEPPIKWVWPARLSANPAAEADVAIKLINAGLLLDEQYLENQGIDPEWFNARMTEQIERRKSWGTVSQETAQIMSSEANKGTTQEVTPDAAAQSSAEYMGLSTLQFKRNQKAILDTLKKLAEGVLTPSQAEVFLAGVGLSPENIAKLLDDAVDGSVDSVAEVPSDG